MPGRQKDTDSQRLMASERGNISESVVRLRREHGFQYLSGAFVPSDFFDERETRFLLKVLTLPVAS
jgi:hypothetical protein